MKNTKSKLIHDRSIEIQTVVTIVLWACLMGVIKLTDISLSDDISLAVFIGVPAAVIGVGQLFVAAHIKRSSYIREYAIAFRTDRELTESFHFLVYRYGNKLFEAFTLNPDQRTSEQQKDLDDAQVGVPEDLRFFNPSATRGSSQERRLDNLLGFFNTLGYDLDRNLISIEDLSGMFGFYLDHFVQRKIVNEYLLKIENEWPKMESFHERYSSPVPFSDFRRMINSYVEYRKSSSKSG